MSDKSIFRVHPAVGFARVGNSEEYYLAPETMAGLPVKGSNSVTTGGLPIRPDTESETITSSDLRDKNGALKRQAARFRIFQYPHDSAGTYPAPEATEVNIGSKVGKKTVKDIIWTVHVANKKANCYVLEDPLAPTTAIIDNYKHGKLPPLRNPTEGSDPNNAARVKKLTIDPGPRAIHGVNATGVAFDKATVATYAGSNGKIHSCLDYPKSFPDDSFAELFCPTGEIKTLGELRTDAQGRLLVLPAYGRAVAWMQADGTPYPLNADVDNDGWFDDTADGPVSATLIFDDETKVSVHGAWVVSTDPAYAPQTLNVVSLWDSIYDVWIRNLGLSPEIFANGFQSSYKPGFEDQLRPIFRSTGLQLWNTNLPNPAIQAHQAVDNITADDSPDKTILAGLAFIRNPNNPAEYEVGAPLMPLALGDSGKPFLSLTPTQYFFLTQWNDKQFVKTDAQPLSAGEYLDKASFINCLGGRFSPGIDMTFIVRQPGMYILDWRETGAGPFRVKPKKIDYSAIQPSQPVLGEGWIPEHSAPTGLEPGDTSKFMALPWHTDYNSCATHNTNPNPKNSTTLYWSWPAQRPVAVYVAADVHGDTLPEQRYSVRGVGTESLDKGKQGRYQERINIVTQWPKIGVVMQGSAIDSGVYNPNYYLEVESRLDVPAVEPWPINSDNLNE